MSDLPQKPQRASGLTSKRFETFGFPEIGEVFQLREQQRGPKEVL